MAYYTESQLPKLDPPDTFVVPPIKLTSDSKEFEADITNINLAGILGLGFPLPKRTSPEDYTFFLKFYAYPDFLSAKLSTEGIFKRFFLDKINDFQVLDDYVGKKGNVVVKKGYIDRAGTVFSAENPYPSFILTKKPVKMGTADITPQIFFDQNIPFASIYVNPKGAEPSGLKADERAEWSANGVLSFHNELMEVYSKNLIEIKGDDEANYRYFLVNLQKAKDRDPNKFSIIKIPQKPLVFKNYRDLPMPHDPNHIFLSGLLLVYHYDFSGPLANPGQMILNSPEFNSAYKLQKSEVLEVGSVVTY